MIPNLDHLVSWVDQLSLDRDIFGWVVVEMVGVFSSDLVKWDRSILWVDRFGDCRDCPTPPFSSLREGYANETFTKRLVGNLTVKACLFTLALVHLLFANIE
jgi:hypothetical protein